MSSMRHVNDNLAQLLFKKHLFEMECFETEFKKVEESIF